MDQSRIDQLLEHYLQLLDQYTRLRSELSTLQIKVFQNIARAKFSAERGITFGQDRYDERMKALRKLEMRYAESDKVLRFQIGPVEEDGDGQNNKRGDDETRQGDERGEQQVENVQNVSTSKDPLRWFSFFVPQPLRVAQSQSIELVESVIPRLLTVRSELLHVEIEIWRAKKQRAKAEAAELKELKELKEGVTVPSGGVA